MNKQYFNELKEKCIKLNITTLLDIDLLQQLTKEDIEKDSPLCYKVSSLLKKLIEYCRIYMYLDGDEETLLFSLNHRQFFSEILNVCSLSQKVLEELILHDIFHSLMSLDVFLEEIYDTNEESAAIIYDIRRNLEEDHPIHKLVEYYGNVTVAKYQEEFHLKVIPVLKKCMQTNSYESAIEALNEYIHLKLELETYLEHKSLLCMSYIAENISLAKNQNICEDIINTIEEEQYAGFDDSQFDPETLDDEEYLNLLILMFENKYDRSNSTRYYYNEQLTEIQKYK